MSTGGCSVLLSFPVGLEELLEASVVDPVSGALDATRLVSGPVDLSLVLESALIASCSLPISANISAASGVLKSSGNFF